MTFGERLVETRVKAGLNQRQLAARMDISPTRLNYWEKDKRQPDVAMIKALAAALNVSADYLIDNPVIYKKRPQPLSNEAIQLARDFDTLDVWGRKQLRATADVEIERCVALEEAAQHEADNVIPLRRSLQPASAGTGTYLGPEEFETIFVADNELTRKAAFAIPVSGSSMEPRYRDGDVLLIEGADDIAVGEIGVFTLDGDGYVKQRGDGELISLNPEFQPVKMTEDVWCNGRVIGVLDPAWVR